MELRTKRTPIPIDIIITITSKRSSFIVVI